MIPNFKVFMPKESVQRVNKVLHSDWTGGDGPQVKEFEQKIASVIKNPYVAAVNSGTSALQLALHISGVRGGEVVSTPMTCFATNAAIVNAGATPVWADITIETGNIDPDSIARAISKRTKAIMVVHWGGAPADLKRIHQVALQHGLPVIEDAAQALGSEYGGKPIGSHSDYVAFSTQSIKIINTVDGGILATKRKRAIDRAKKLRWYGIDREKRKWSALDYSWSYPITEVGYKMQMTDVQAAIGLGQLPYLQSVLERRRRIAAMYEQALFSSKTIKAQKILPPSISNYWMFTVICNSPKTKEKLVKLLKALNVRAEVAHTRNDLYPVFAAYKKDLPGVSYFNDRHVIIPVGQWVPMQKAKQIAAVLASQ